jgi:hypothetical protein
MTMYLSNPYVRPTGYEAGEFIEPVVDVLPAEPSPAPSETADDGDEKRLTRG